MPEDIALREATPADAATLGRICFDAFRSISEQHNFEDAFPNVETATGNIARSITHPGFYGVVAERNGTIIGSNFLDERTTISGVGPLTVDPAAQDRGVGRALMRAVLERSAARGASGVRLLQSAYHMRSLALYTSLGFVVRETLGVMVGAVPPVPVPGRLVRPASTSDLEACNRACRQVHGFDRSGELADGIAAGMALVVETGGTVTGYASMLGFGGHAAGLSDDDMKALIGSGAPVTGPGLLVSVRSPLFAWCLEQKLRVAVVMTLMSTGMYQEPQGSFMPSILL